MANLKQFQSESAPKSQLYSQAIGAGNFLFIAGQLALDPKTNALVEGGIIEQTKQTFHNLQAVLKAAGLDFHDLVRVEIYLRDIRDLKMVNTLYLEIMKHSPKPVRHAMQVGHLPFDALIEVTCIAVKK